MSTPTVATKEFQELSTLAILNIRELVTMDSKYGVPRVGSQMNDLGIVHKAAVVIHKDTIIFVGTMKEFDREFSHRDFPIIINGEHRLVTPGFVDPHTHIIFDGTRENELQMKLSGMSYLDILNSGEGILKTVKATREASISKLVENGHDILDRMLEYGTTTIETKSGYGLTVEDEIKSLKTMKILDKEHPIEIIPTFLGAHAIPPEYAGRSDDYVDLIISNMLPLIKEQNLAQFCDVFCEKGIFSVPQTRKILQAAQDFGLDIQIHIDEIVDTNGAQLAADLNAVQTGHLLKSNDTGLRAMAEKQVVATLLPGTPFCMMLREYAPARKMIEIGIPIALATDLNPNCWTESMQMILALACYKMKMNPAEALTASTINAAFALRRHDDVGSIEVGKQADLVLFDVPNHNYLPYQFGVNHVLKVIKKGDIVVDFE
ncbi:MAG: imidazolonepropionase [Candidatus Lokiarchaeota archaeon]|nr:imidazolonepropionase [Candidatus Lokiarchaeota archaeon]